MSLIITIYWIYRGLRRGVYPALNILFVFFVPRLITLNYYDAMFGVVGMIKADTTQSTRETIAFIGTYLLTFSICVYLCLWLCAEKLRLSKTLDMVAGGILGAVTGMICCGALMLIWFSLPLSRQMQVEVADTDMFYKPQDYALQAATVVAGRIKGDRLFSGERFLRDLRYGLPQVPTLGNGYYVSSVPTGLKVFINPGSDTPGSFLLKIEERLKNPEKDIPPSEQAEVRVEKGRTPFLLQESGGTALIAVVMESVPPELAEQASASDPQSGQLFASDGEVGYANETDGDRKMYIKIYQANKAGAVSSEIGLFQPRDAAKYGKLFEGYWPAKTCFPFNDGEVETQMTVKGATMEEARALLRQLHFCGKAIFTGSEGKIYALELGAPDQPARVSEVEPGKDLKAKPAAH